MRSRRFFRHRPLSRRHINDADRYAARSVFSRWAYQEDVPRHLYFFSETTLKLYAARAGLAPALGGTFDAADFRR